MAARTIEHAAVRVNGYVWLASRPNRHHTILQELAGKTTGRREQGFIDSDGNFVDREEALRVAVAAGQLKADPIAPPNLYTEDLW